MELATITEVHLEYESPDDRYGRVKMKGSLSLPPILI